MKKMQRWVIMGIIFLLASSPILAKAEKGNFEGELEEIGSDHDTGNPLIIVRIDDARKFFMLAGPDADLTYRIGSTFMITKVKDGFVWQLPTGRHIVISCTMDRKKYDSGSEYYYCYDMSLSYTNPQRPVVP